MIFNFSSSYSNQPNTFWGISYDTWGIIGSILIPIIILFLGYLITNFVSRHKRKIDLIEQIDLLILLGQAKSSILTNQIEALDKFSKSISEMQGTTNEILTLHQFDYNDLKNLNFTEISRSFINLAKGKKNDNFQLISGFQNNIIHTSELYEYMKKYYNDMYDDLIKLKNEWNDRSNDVTDIKRNIYNERGDADTISVLAKLDAEYPQVENNIPNFVKYYVNQISDFLGAKYRKFGKITPLELSMLTACSRINQVYGDYIAVKEKYFNCYNDIKLTFESNKTKLDETITRFEKIVYISGPRLFFGSIRK